MDTGKGKFEILDAATKDIQDAIKEMEANHPSHGGWFHVGEIIEIRGSRFRVKAVKPHELHLKLLPKE